MKKKRILSYVLTIGIVLGGANVAYASGTTEETTKAAVESTVVDSEKNEFISNEEAVDIANKAMKDYLNRDANSYVGTKITLYNKVKNIEFEFEGKKYMISEYYAKFINEYIKENNMEGARTFLKLALEDSTPSTIMVHFETSDEVNGGYKDNEVTMNAHTGEVLRVSREQSQRLFKGEVNKEKIKESIINVLAKSNLKADENTNWDSIIVFKDYAEAVMYLNVDGGKPVQVEIDLDDFSIINFYKLYVMYPGEDFGIK